MRDLCCTGCTPIINQVKISLLTEKKTVQVAVQVLHSRPFGKNDFYLTTFPLKSITRV